MHSQLRTQGTAPWCQGAHRVNQDISEPGDPVTLPRGRGGSCPVQLWHWGRAGMCLCVVESNPNNPLRKQSTTLKLKGLWGNTAHCVYLKDKGKSNKKHFLYWSSLPKCLSYYSGEFFLYHIWSCWWFLRIFCVTMKAGDGLSAPEPWNSGMVPSRPFRQLRWLQVTHNSLEYTEILSLRSESMKDHAFKHDHVLLQVVPCACYKAVEQTVPQKTSCYCHFSPCFRIAGSLDEAELSQTPWVSVIAQEQAENQISLEAAHTGGPDRDFLIKGAACCASAMFTENLCIFLINSDQRRSKADINHLSS